MVPPENYDRTIDQSSGKVYINPNPPGTIPTAGVPALGLTQNNEWVPFTLQSDGTLPPAGIIVSNPHFDDAQAETDPGEPQTLIDVTVPEGVTRSISSVIIKTRVTGSFAVLVNSTLIGSGRTGPGGAPTMNFNPARPLSAGDEYQVIFTSRFGSAVTDVEAYVQANDANN